MTHKSPFSKKKSRSKLKHTLTPLHIIKNVLVDLAV